MVIAPRRRSSSSWVYWILNGIVTLRLGMVAAGGPRRRLAIAAGAIGIATGATVLLANVSTIFLLAITAS